MSREDKVTKHPSFGHASVSRCSGHADLFMVDYPQQHFMRLSISTADLHRSLSHDDVYHGPSIVEVWMDEIQWAALVAGVGSSGTPCTLMRYRDPDSGESMTPKMPVDTTGNAAAYKAEIEEMTKKATSQMKAALKELDEVMSGKTVRKGDLEAIRSRFNTAVAHMEAGIPFIAESANEAIHGAEKKAEANLTAFADHTMVRLGERALGDRLEQSLRDGVDLKLIGSAVAGQLTEKA
jgi:hypothetical protein